MVKFIKDYKFRTVTILKNNSIIAVVSLDDLKELVNNFELDTQLSKDLR